MIQIINRFFENWGYRMKEELKDIFRPYWYNLKDFVYETSYHLYRMMGKKPKIMSFDETIDYIIDNKCSVSRFGDGEIVLMLGRHKIGFQELVPQLSEDLLSSFKAHNPNLLVCMKGLFFDSKPKSQERKFYQYYYFEYYRYFLKHIDFDYMYGAADLTRFYEPSNWAWTNFEELEQYVERLRRIWEDQNVVFVEGRDTKLGIGNNLYDNTNSIRRILCPPTNAYEYKDEIAQSIKKNANKGDLVLLALGPTASILASELAVTTDLWLIDIGHIDVVYFWMKNRCKYKMGIEGKFVNEADKNAEVIKINFDKELYEAQIIDRIGE